MRPRPRAGRRAGRALAVCDQAISEVIGYVLMLFLSSMVLMVSLQAFLTSRETTQDIQAGSELRILVERLAAEVQQAGFVASEMPNATFEAALTLPALGGRPYYLDARGSKVWANTTDNEVSAESEVEVGTLGSLTLQGMVYSGQGLAKVRYERHPASGDRWINLTV